MKLIDCEPRRHSAPILAIFNEAIANSTALYDYQPRAAESMVWRCSRSTKDYRMQPVLHEMGGTRAPDAGRRRNI